MTLILMILGFLGVASSFYVPHKERFSCEHATWAGIIGVIWMIFCFILAMRTLSL